jgi:hypothetical protein
MLPSDYQFQPVDDRYVSNARAAEESRAGAVRTAIGIVAANVAAIVVLILITA